MRNVQAAGAGRLQAVLLYSCCCCRWCWSSRHQPEKTININILPFSWLFAAKLTEVPGWRPHTLHAYVNLDADDAPLPTTLGSSIAESCFSHPFRLYKCYTCVVLVAVVCTYVGATTCVASCSCVLQHAFPAQHAFLGSSFAVGNALNPRVRRRAASAVRLAGAWRPHHKRPGWPLQRASCAILRG